WRRLPRMRRWGRREAWDLRKDEVRKNGNRLAVLPDGRAFLCEGRGAFEEVLAGEQFVADRRVAMRDGVEIRWPRLRVVHDPHRQADRRGRGLQDLLRNLARPVQRPPPCNDPVDHAVALGVARREAAPRQEEFGSDLPRNLTR